MKLRNKIGSSLILLLLLSVGGLAVALSYQAPCEPIAAPADGVPTMRAVMYSCYGGTEVLQLAEVARPEPGAEEVLIKIQAAGVNPLDWHYMRGAPYIMRLMSGIGRPTDQRNGVDFAGTVVAVGAQVRDFKAGDEVFGGRGGAFAQYILSREDRALALKPDNVSFAEAAAIPIAAVTALQALRDKGQLQSGQRVLVNGASGGVGTYAVQIAKAMGAEVTGVCSARNADLVRALGADKVIDYKVDQYPDLPARYDLIVDNIGNHSLTANRSVLEKNGKLIMVGGETGNWLGALIAPLNAMIQSPFVDQEMLSILAQLNRADLELLADLMRKGQLKSVIDKHYPMADIADAIAYSESGRARGKIIIDIE